MTVVSAAAGMIQGDTKSVIKTPSKYQGESIFYSYIYILSSRSQNVLYSNSILSRKETVAKLYSSGYYGFHCWQVFMPTTSKPEKV